jgi:hypothetical protein
MSNIGTFVIPVSNSRDLEEFIGVPAKLPFSAEF